MTGGRFACLGALMAALAFLVMPSHQADADTTSTAATTQVSNATISRNWAGYQSTGGSYTSVSGSWVVPSVAANTVSEYTADAAWVGIGGVVSNDLIQAGTQEITDSKGDVTYQAWYELLPSTSQTVPLTISAGDAISVSINLVSGSANSGTSQWSINITDQTTGKSYSTTVNYASTLSSAEWVEEMPSTALGNQNVYIPLDAFGSINFTGANTTENGLSMSLSQINADPLEITNNQNQPLTSLSTIGSNGSFTVTRTANSAGNFGAGNAEINAYTGYGSSSYGNGGSGNGLTPAIMHRSGWRRGSRAQASTTVSGGNGQVQVQGYSYVIGNGFGGFGQGTGTVTQQLGPATVKIYYYSPRFGIYRS